MAYQNFYILSHRPLLFLQPGVLDLQRVEQQSSGSDLGAPLVCRNAARRIIQLCQTYREHYTLQCVPFMIAHYLTNACTICIIDLDNEKPTIGDQANDDMTTCISLLHEMAAVWEVGTNALALIDDLRAKREVWVADQRASRSPANFPSDGFEATAANEVPARNALSDFFGQEFDFWDFNLMFPNIGQDHEFL